MSNTTFNEEPVKVKYTSMGEDYPEENIKEWVRMPSGDIVVRVESGESLWFDKDGNHPKSKIIFAASQLHPVSKSEGERIEEAIRLLTDCGYEIMAAPNEQQNFHPVSKDALTQAVEFAEWIGEQGLFNGLSPDNIRRWHKLVGNSKAVTTPELYTQFKNQKQ